MKVFSFQILKPLHQADSFEYKKLYFLADLLMALWGSQDSFIVKSDTTRSGEVLEDFFLKTDTPPTVRYIEAVHGL